MNLAISLDWTASSEASVKIEIGNAKLHCCKRRKRAKIALLLLDGNAAQGCSLLDSLRGCSRCGRVDCGSL